MIQRPGRLVKGKELKKTMTIGTKRLIILAVVILAGLVLGRLADALEAHGVPYDYIVFPHSGHGLQNDNRQARLYYEKINEYLNTYLH